jgi:ArsR family transcriptional regulator
MTTAAPPLDQVENALKALADRTRLRILALLGSNEVCVCHIHDSLGLPQPTVSRHLAYLRRSGLVAARRDGVWMHYRISPGLPAAVQTVMQAAVQGVAGTPVTTEDQERFSRAFGRLYVINSDGAACCSPRSS